MWNAGLAFQVLTRNLSKAHPYILNVDKATEMPTKEKEIEIYWIYYFTKNS